MKYLFARREYLIVKEKSLLLLLSGGMNRYYVK